MKRPVLLVSRELVSTGRAVWEARAVLGAVPEVHVEDGGRFLTAAEAAPLVPWAREELGQGLDYEGTLFDALSGRRIAFLLPLLAGTNGSVQGLLEFEDVAYAGCGMTSAILASDRGHSLAVLDSLGIGHSDAGSTSFAVSVVGNEELVAAAAGAADAEAERFACRVYHGLGAGGWASVEVVRDPELRWRSVTMQPDLHPDGGFLAPLAREGLGLEAVLTRVLRWGQMRHDAEVGLRNSFKDKI